MSGVPCLLMGSPGPRQIDGIGGAHPLTSKVAVVSPSSAPDADVDHLFLQLGVGQATGRTAATCSPASAHGPEAVRRHRFPALTAGPAASLR